MLAGLHRGPILLEDANDIADIMASTKRIPPANKWVTEFVEAEQYLRVMSI